MTDHEGKICKQFSNGLFNEQIFNFKQISIVWYLTFFRFDNDQFPIWCHDFSRSMPGKI